ncbi:cysteine desulfurase family protein [Tepidibacillus fermentans]|uniref:cysteine desulfurase n=1 Tax=Tepidibacillus fermentans TaxID=1281767 RepID=A0A4R3KLT6_9BACI|nr:cysteine desulfurase family protein [Tepidibacillus fermentans]TCS83813.1 cysteine desulfurase [Tepidibacillus fermentans]
MNRIYLDHAATTPVHPQVFEKIKPFLQEKFGNPSSIHTFGQTVKLPLEDARVYVARALNVHQSRIVFTSGGTESDIQAIIGVALANQEKGKHIIISEIEHSAVIEATKWLRDFGFEITAIPVNRNGIVNMEQLQASIRKDTILISVMYVNNEIGTIQPIKQIGEMAREQGIIFHTDAVQALPILNIDLDQLPVDLMTISSHKINGPKGVGALYIREHVPFKPLFGGSQERSRRGGTENVPGIVGFGEAAKILKANLKEKQEHTKHFREKMISIWKQELGKESFVIIGDLDQVVPSILNVSFPGVETQSMIMNLDMKGIAVSGGSACASGALTVSRVIQALHLEEKISRSVIRISFGYGNTEDEIIQAATVIANIVKQKRK